MCNQQETKVLYKIIIESSETTREASFIIWRRSSPISIKYTVKK